MESAANPPRQPRSPAFESWLPPESLIATPSSRPSSRVTRLRIPITSSKRSSRHRKSSWALMPSNKFKIKVPGSIANLGPGFDTLAVAVQLYLQLSVTVAPGRNTLHFEFLNAKLDGENYIERAFRFLAQQRGESFPSLMVQVESEIPAKAGLGSSAAATVAGLRVYEALARAQPQQR